MNHSLLRRDAGYRLMSTGDGTAAIAKANEPETIALESLQGLVAQLYGVDGAREELAGALNALAEKHGLMEKSELTGAFAAFRDALHQAVDAVGLKAQPGRKPEPVKKGFVRPDTTFSALGYINRPREDEHPHDGAPRRELVKDDGDHRPLRI